MPYRICKSLEVENGHMLSKHPDACRFPHGHTRRVEFVIESDTLDDRGMVCDFKIIKQVVGDYVDRFDHAMCMNTSDPMYETMKAAFGGRILGFENMEPTTEVLAKDLFDACAAALRDYAQQGDVRYPLAPGVRLLRVRVWETSSSWAEYGCE